MKHRTTQYSDRNRSHNTEGHIIRTSGENHGAYMMLVELMLGKDYESYSEVLQSKI